MKKYGRKMSLFLIASTSILFVQWITCAQEKNAEKEQFLTWMYKETPMGLYIPEKTTEKPLPIVMFLHGCHNNPISRDFWIISALNKIEPCAVFLPTAPEMQNTEYSCSDWGGTYDSGLRPQMENALFQLDSLVDYYKFDTKRQYIYGESMGGEGIFSLLVDYPERFAGAVSAAGYTLNKGASQMAKTPLWIFCGESDDICPVNTSREIYKSIVNAGGASVKFTAYPDAGHVEGIELARKETEMHEWLLKQCTGIIKQIGNKRYNTSFTPNFSIIDGELCLSSSLPLGTIITFFDLTGKVFFKTKTDVSIDRIKLPIKSTRKSVVWNVSNSQFNLTGKALLFRR